MKDLPILLSLSSYRKGEADSAFDTVSEESTPLSSTTSFLEQTFSLALDPTAPDPGTIPLSPSIFNVSANRPRAIAAVVIGAGFKKEWERISESCEDVDRKVTWFRPDVEKSKELRLDGRMKSEDLGRSAKAVLEQWVEEGVKGE